MNYDEALTEIKRIFRAKHITYKRQGEYLLDEARKHGSAPSLYAEVIYSAGDGFAVIDYADRGSTQ